MGKLVYFHCTVAKMPFDSYSPRTVTNIPERKTQNQQVNFELKYYTNIIVAYQLVNQERRTFSDEILIVDS